MSEQVASKGLITAEDLKEFLECPVCLRVPRYHINPLHTVITLAQYISGACYTTMKPA